MRTGCQPPTRTSRRRAGVALGAALLFVLLAWSGPGLAAPRQTDPVTTPTTGVSITTTDDLLEGSTTVPPTTADPASTTQPSGGGSNTSAGDETRTVWLIVAALVLIAAALSYLTFRYWQRTAPSRPAPFDQDRADEPDPDLDPKPRPRPERRPSAAR
ncbi:MAG: hypothetical protein JO291_08295 [Acidimicrobiia bacterium]|nr:hypothetical protein [Acidimicrobiia bacterium]